MRKLDRAAIWSLGMWLCFGLGPVMLICLKPPWVGWMKVIELAIGASASIGTAAAAVVALTLGASTDRRRDAEAQAMAKVMSSRIVIRLRLLKGGVVRSLPSLDASEAIETRKAAFISLFKVFEQQPDWMSVSNEELLVILPLGVTCAQSIAAAIEELKLGRTGADILSSAEWSTLDEAEKKDWLDTLRDKVSLASEYLTHALSIIEKAATSPRGV